MTSNQGDPQRDCCIGLVLKLLSRLSNLNGATGAIVVSSAERSLGVLCEHLDEEKLLTHPFRLRQAIADLYYRTCSLPSFKKRYREAQNIDSISKKDIRQSNDKTTEDIELCVVDMYNLFDNSKKSDVFALGDMYSCAIPWESTNYDTLDELISLHEEHCDERSVKEPRLVSI